MRRFWSGLLTATTSQASWHLPVAFSFCPLHSGLTEKKLQWNEGRRVVRAAQRTLRAMTAHGPCDAGMLAKLALLDSLAVRPA